MREPAERGATHIADRVVAKIAAQAVREALRAGPGGSVPGDRWPGPGLGPGPGDHGPAPADGAPADGGAPPGDGAPAPAGEAAPAAPGDGAPPSAGRPGSAPPGRPVAPLSAAGLVDGAGPPDPRPYTAVTVHGEVARIKVSLELGYPTDIGERCGAVRRRVTERVGALAGMEVPEVAVTVARLHPRGAGRATRGRVR